MDLSCSSKVFCKNHLECPSERDKALYLLITYANDSARNLSQDVFHTPSLPSSQDFPRLRESTSPCRKPSHAFRSFWLGSAGAPGRSSTSQGHGTQVRMLAFTASSFSGPMLMTTSGGRLSGTSCTKRASVAVRPSPGGRGQPRLHL